MAVRRFQAPRADRLDKVVAAGCADLTRSAAQKLIGSGGVGVNGVVNALQMVGSELIVAGAFTQAGG